MALVYFEPHELIPLCVYPYIILRYGGLQMEAAQGPPHVHVGLTASEGEQVFKRSNSSRNIE